MRQRCLRPTPNCLCRNSQRWLTQWNEGGCTDSRTARAMLECPAPSTRAWLSRCAELVADHDDGGWLLADLDCDRYSPRKTNRPCTCWCEINDPAMDERATVVDRHNNRAAIMLVCYSYFRSERQRPMCRGQSAGVQSPTTRSLAAALDGIHRCYSGLCTKRGRWAKCYNAGNGSSRKGVVHLFHPGNIVLQVFPALGRQEAISVSIRWR
jgi:hypothetical protein